MLDRWIVFATLAVALVLFVRGVWRYDLVALLALLVLCAARIIPADEAFLGFGHPAVVTVAAVLIISAAMRSAGLTDILGGWLERIGDSPGRQVLILTSVVAVLSSFMNNVGALAIVMPAAIQLARTTRSSPSQLLMPIAFGSLLGGLVTLIGTPPNIIVANMRPQGGPFSMFDFAPVGGGVALAGLLFIGFIGWRLVPLRKGETTEELFEIDKYTAELRVKEGSRAAGMSIRELGAAVESEYTIIGLAHKTQRISMPAMYEGVVVGDILLVEGDAEAIKALTDGLGLELVGDKELRDELLQSEAVEVVEAIVTAESYMEKRSAASLDLRRRFSVNLLGVARQGHRLQQRLAKVRLRAGDILLLQGESQTLQQAICTLGCLPLAHRGLRLGRPRRALLLLALFAAALVLMIGGWLSAQVALVACAVAMVLTRLLPLREAYNAIDWPIIILLGAMIPVGGAMETTGGADMIANGLHALTHDQPPVISIGAILIATTLLTALINNTAAAVLMAPIALRVAAGMGASADPYLMAVALGASSDYMTPIGHQSNTLVMGPGGYRFGDYFRVGFPVTVISWAVGLFLILLVWRPFPQPN